jgi:hypothetical protein
VTRSAGEFGSELALAAEEVRRRSRGRCEARIADVCTTYAADGPHHRRMRSQGGPDTVENLLDLCPPCHRWVHAHPRISYEAGWLLDAAGARELGITP